MADRIVFEWVIETVVTVDGDEDIYDVHHSDTFAEAMILKAQLDAEKSPDERIDVALRRDVEKREEGVVVRGYSYLRDRELEPRFSSYHPDGKPANDGPEVLMRYHLEVMKWMAENG